MGYSVISPHTPCPVCGKLKPSTKNGLSVFQCHGLNNIYKKNNMKTPLENFILGELECPCCYNYMCPPINQCLDGHNICNGCFTRIFSCPKCKNRKSNTARNYALEAIYGILNVPCTYQLSGCKHECLGDLMIRHQKYCWYGPKNCPFQEYSNCSWKDSMKDLKGHLMELHSLNFYLKEKQKFVSENFWKIKKYHYIFAVIYVYEQFFRLTWEIDTSGMTRWAIYFMGSPEDAAKYYYKLEINKATESKNTIPLTFKSVCYDMPDTEHKFGGHNCFYIHKNLLDKYCGKNGDLHYKVSIYPLEEKEEEEEEKLHNSVTGEDEDVSDLALLFDETKLK